MSLKPLFCDEQEVLDTLDRHVLASHEIQEPAPRSEEPRFIPPTETPAPGERFELRAVEDWMGNGPIGHMVLVQWVDAACEDHWRPYQDAHDVALGHCRSVGWLVAADADRLVLSANREDGSGDVSSVWVIPAGAVQRVCVFEAVDGQSDGGEILGTREAFEQWFKRTEHPYGFSPSINLERCEDGQYLHPVVEHLWWAWIASARPPQGPALREWELLKNIPMGQPFQDDDGFRGVRCGKADEDHIRCVVLAGSSWGVPGTNFLFSPATLVIRLEVESL